MPPLADPSLAASTPLSVTTAQAAEPGRIGELKKFTLWETKTRFYLVAYNTSQTRFCILKVDRTPPIAVTAGPTLHQDRLNDAAKDVSAGIGSSRSDPPVGASSSALRDRQSHFDTRRAAGSKDAYPCPPAVAASLAEPHVTALTDPSSLSASGQRYLSEDDTSIPQLNKTLLDTKQAEAAAKDGQPAVSQTALASGSKSIIVSQSTVPFAAGSVVAEASVRPPVAASAAANAPSAAQPHDAFSQPKASSSRRYPSHGRSAADAGWELNVTSDTVVYTRSQVTELLDMIREGNRSSGGLREVGRFFGIVGFVRFTGTYYMVLISRRSVVALIGGHYIYHCDETVTLPVCHPIILAALPGRTKAQDQEESRLLHLFKQVDLGKNFYFSYTYDLTKTLQDNLTSSPQGSEPLRAAGSPPKPSITAWSYNEKFVWNHHLLMPAFGASERTELDVDPQNGWVLPLVYGFVDQAKLSVLSRTVYVTLIARRSRHFAGARFLKRGVNERGQVANDVETEQIVTEALTTPFFAPSRRPVPTRPGRRSCGDLAMDQRLVVRPTLCDQRGVDVDGRPATPTGSEPHIGQDRACFDASPRYTSYVMMRGSIPIYWTQDSTNMSPRPPIEISLVDPFYSAAALHFDDLFHRYGTPVIVLNLIKSKEKQEREVKLLRAFGECIDYLNQFLPAAKRIRHIAWDMSRASKSHDQDVIGILEDIAEETVETTRFFHSGPEPGSFGDAASAVFAHEHRVLSDRTAVDESWAAQTDASARRNGGGGDVDSDADGESAGAARRDTILLQDGVVRINCVDCLDRTNAAQFVIGKAAFGHQLHALGLLDDPSLPFDSDAVNMLTEMYHDLGDTIAMQYGGSALAHTTDTYRKINQWTSHSRDVLESMKRFYANSFADADKQAAINLFLGVDPDAPDFAPYVFAEKVLSPTISRDGAAPTTHTLGGGGKSGLGERAPAPSAPASHVPAPAVPFRPHYRQWYHPAHLEANKAVRQRTQRLKDVANTDAGFWAEYYRPSLFTDLQRHHAYKMTAVHQQSGHGTGSAVAGHGHAGGAQGSAAYGAMGRHMRNASTSSVATASPAVERAIVYPSPFKPRGASSQARPGPSTVRAHTAGRRNHLRRNSIDSTGISNTTVPAARGGSVPPSPSSSSVATSAPSKALIGGVKRWMSINRPAIEMGSNGKRGQRRSASMTDESDDQRQTRRGQLGGGGGADAGHGGWSAAGVVPPLFSFAGPWQAMGIGITGVAAGMPNQAIPAAHYTMETVLAKVCQPSVSREEEAEYTFYTSQFRNESLAAGGDSLGFASMSNALSRAGLNTDGRGRGGGAEGDSNRFIDEKDVRIYEESVALKQGDGATVGELLRFSGGGGNGGVDPALIAYASSCEALASTTSATLDAKARAYSSWLQMGF